MEPRDPMGSREPPADPEEWTDEQWLTWLEMTDTEMRTEREVAPSTPIGRVARSSGGQVVGQAMLGMAQAIYGRQDDEVAIVTEGPRDPADDEPYAVHLDPDHPERSSVTLRKGSEPPP